MPGPLPLIRPTRLSRAKQSFDAPEWIFELKHDRFRALAYLENGSRKLISRNRHEFRGFKPLCKDSASCLKVRDSIVDGENCCLGADGRSISLA